MIFFINVLILFGIVFWGYKTTRKSPLGQFYIPAVSIKILAGIAVGLIYSMYYTTGDTWVMFGEAIKLKNVAFSSVDNLINTYYKSDYTSIHDFAYPIQPRAAFMAKIVGVLALITGDNYWLCSIYLSLLSFTGFWLLAISIYSISGSRWIAVIPTLLFPSIVFWTSGILKESIAIGALAAVMGIMLKGYNRQKLNWFDWLILLVGLILVAQLKYYYAAIFIVAIISLFGTRSVLPRHSKWYWELLTVIGFYIVLMGIGSQAHPNFWPSRFLTVIADNYDQYAQLSESGNFVVFNGLSPTIASFLIHSPKALLAGLVFPVWFEMVNVLKIPVLIENWILIAAILYNVRYFNLPQRPDSRILLFTVVIFIIIAAILLTFSAPNYGTLVRYKTGYLLVFVSLLSLGISNRLRLS